MRTVSEIVEAARLGDPCTEEEMRCCIAALHYWNVKNHLMMAHLATDEAVPEKYRREAAARWEDMKLGRSIPVDRRLGPENMPGNPWLKRRKKISQALVRRVLGEGQGGEDA